jgi:Spy/CpxP family protein refolding chaperone
MLCTSGISLAQDGDKPANPQGDTARPRREGARQRPQAQADGEKPAGERQRPAGGGGAGGIREREEQLQKALSELNLTDEQKTQIDKIRAETREKMEALRGQLKDMSPEDRRAKLREAVGNPLEQIGAVLTEEQKTQLREKMQAGGGPGAREGAREGRDPTSQPTTRPNADGPRGRGPMIDRLKENLAKLDLTADQKAKTDVVLDEAAAAVAKLREDAKGDLATVRDQATKIMEQTREKLQAILTPEQAKQLQDSMGPRPGGPQGGPGGPGAREGQPPAGKTGDAKPATPSPDKARVDNSKATNSTPAKAEVASSPAQAAEKLAVGMAAPDFTLGRVGDKDVKPVGLASYRGKPTVLIFGSFTSPTFRDKAPGFEALKKDLRGKINMALIYTREAYPVNEWEVQRNIDEQIKVDLAVSLEDRTKMARLTRDGMKLTMDVLVDDMDDGVATKYAAMPNGMIVLDENGKILGRQKWADPHAAKVILEEAGKTK